MTSAPASIAPPVWNAIERDVKCPLCDYNLRGLVEPRCPECGYRFEWQKVLDANLRLHRYLFEHHPERNWWSLKRTIAGGFQPEVFWTELSPGQTSNPRRLLVYLLITFITPMLALVILSVQYYQMAKAIWRKMPPGWPLNAPWRTITDMFRITDTSVPMVLVLAMLCWPFITALALLVFRASMRLARVKPIHTFRCVVYSADPIIFLGAVLMLIIIARPGLRRGATDDALKFWMLLALVVLTYRLFVAYRRYMRFDHAFATVLASQIIFVLVMLKVMFMLVGH